MGITGNPVGLGIMGNPMAANLIDTGHKLKVYCRTRSKCDAISAKGAVLCDSPARVAAETDVFISMLPDTADVEAVLFAPDGAAAELRPGSIAVDMSTISPSATMSFSERLAKSGVSMLDAPVSGGELGAQNGTLSIMAGGSREIFERCLPIFRALGKKIVHAGPSGSGQKTKFVNQVVGALNLLATVEGIRLAQAAGLDLPNTLSAIASGSAGSWMWANLGSKIVTADFAPGFSIRLQEKDLRLAREFLDELKMEAPGTALTYELFARSRERGLGGEGNQGLYNLWP